MSIKKNIPNAITCMNLISGSLACFYACMNNYTMAFYLVILAGVFDFFDGFCARLLKVSSPIGKDLDSLADVVSFGVAPGLTVFCWLRFSGICDYLHLAALLIPAFSALRLAKFNNDPRQTSSFIGLPTPANAIFFCSLIASREIGLYSSITESPLIMFLLIVASCYLLVSEIPMFSLKMKNTKWEENKIRFVFLGLSLLLLIFLQIKAFPLIIVIFVILSVFSNQAGWGLKNVGASKHGETTSDGTLGYTDKSEGE